MACQFSTSNKKTISSNFILFVLLTPVIARQINLQLPLPDMHQAKTSATYHLFIHFLFVLATSLCSTIQTTQKPDTNPQPPSQHINVLIKCVHEIQVRSEPSGRSKFEYTQPTSSSCASITSWEKLPCLRHAVSFVFLLVAHRVLTILGVSISAGISGISMKMLINGRLT